MQTATIRTCPQCSTGFPVDHGNRIYCSRPCYTSAHTARRKAQSAAHRRTHERVCEHCGSSWKTRYQKSKYCSMACANKVISTTRKPRVVPKAAPSASQCGWCLALHFDTRNKYCSPECERSSKMDQGKAMRSSLRAAYEDGDNVTFLDAIRAQSRINQQGCWVWSKRIQKDYPVIKIAGKTLLVHRLVIEARYQQPLGSQHAHHMCANTRCVNPEHLQPVTHRENIAEMLTRQSYLVRIVELESALAEVNPAHPLLSRIALK